MPDIGEIRKGPEIGRCKETKWMWLDRGLDKDAKLIAGKLNVPYRG